MTPAQFKEARHKLGLSCAKLAALWGMGAHGGRTIRRWEDGERPMNPVAVFALGLMLERNQ